MQTRNYFLSRLVLFFTLGVSFLFIQCEKEELSIQSTALGNKQHLALSIDAEYFASLLEENDTEFTGVFVKYDDGVIEFEKVNIVENRFIPTGKIFNPKFEKVLISINGDIQSYVTNENSKASRVDLPTDFDFVYFNWLDLKVLAANSHNIYLSRMEVNYGLSIHATESKDNQMVFPTIKL